MENTRNNSFIRSATDSERLPSIEDVTTDLFQTFHFAIETRGFGKVLGVA